MEIDRLNDDWNKVKTKKQLLELLNEYKGILTETMLDYLKSLINLDFSVIREYISDSDRKVLAELEIYKKVAIYNIYKRAQDLFNKQDGEFIIYGNNRGNEGLSVSTKLSDRNVKLFDFDYKEIHSNAWDIPEIPKGFKTLHIGYISLFQLLENKEMLESELNQIKNKLECLYNEKNPYQSGYSVDRLIGVNIREWNFYHNEIIKEYEKQYRELTKKEVSDIDKKEIEIKQYFHELLTEDFGLVTEDFEDISKEKSRMLIKRMPNLTIIDNIKYI